MSCRRFELLLPASVDQRLDPAQRSEVDAHVADCRDCAAELEAMLQARKALAACGPAEPPADLADRISQSVRMAVQNAETTPSFWDRFIPVAWPAAVAATVAAAVLLTLSLRAADTTTSSSATAPPPTDPVEQVSTAVANNDVQLASTVLGMELD